MKFKKFRRKVATILRTISVVGIINYQLIFNAHAFLGDGGAGWAQIPYLANILAENIRRYEQLRLMIDMAKNKHDYLKLINEGLENSIGLLNSLPIKDEKILSDLRSYSQAYKSITDIYGKVPESKEAGVQVLLDQSVAESIKMVGSVNEYAKTQEENALMLSIQSRQASPKGAARMNAETNSRILHTLNQLLKINGQILKLQSEQLALTNKMGKESVNNFQKINRELRGSMKDFSGNFSLPRF